MKTLKRYVRLYKVFVMQFFKSLVQSKADFLIGLCGFFFTQITGIAFCIWYLNRYLCWQIGVCIS